MAAATSMLTETDIDRLRLVALRLARRIRTSSVEELTPSQLTVLGTVIRKGPITIGQIAELEHVKPPSVSKIVAALEVGGYIAREDDPADRRCVFIVATPEGSDYVDTVRAAGRTWLASQLVDVDEHDLARIIDALPALERLLEVDE
jgi:DNA-binding MarR family transcriptional regulator